MRAPALPPGTVLATRRASPPAGKGFAPRHASAAVGQLAERLRDLMRSYGWDPAARDGELAALDAMEAADAKAAHHRFLELRRAFAERYRADLLAKLRGFPFVLDVPPAETRGMGLREVESEARVAERALRQARAIQQGLDAEAEARSALAKRSLAPAPPFPAASWERLAPLVEEADARRRLAAREARVEARAAEAAKRAARLRRLRVAVPETARLPAADADARLGEVEAATREAEALEAAHDAATRPLRDPAVSEWLRESRRALQREADAALEARDLAGLAAAGARAEALRKDAAARAEAAARARRRGGAAPERERRAGDAMDPYA